MFASMHFLFYFVIQHELRMMLANLHLNSHRAMYVIIVEAVIVAVVAVVSVPSEDHCSRHWSTGSDKFN